MNVSDAGVIAYDYYAWYEWFPLTWQDYAMDVEAGDKMTVWCQSNSDSDRYCTMTNSRTSIELTTVLPAPAPFLVLAGQNAEWIVEDFDDNGIIPFANFRSVTFTNCEAIANNVTTAAWERCLYEYGAKRDCLDLCFISRHERSPAHVCLKGWETGVQV